MRGENAGNFADDVSGHITERAERRRLLREELDHYQARALLRGTEGCVRHSVTPPAPSPPPRPGRPSP